VLILDHEGIIVGKNRRCKRIETSSRASTVCGSWKCRTSGKWIGLPNFRSRPRAELHVKLTRPLTCGMTLSFIRKSTSLSRPCFSLLVGAMLNEHGRLWCSPLPIIPNGPLSNSLFKAVVYESVLQSCLSPLNLLDGDVHQNLASPIF